METNQYYPFGTLYLNDKEYELQRYKYNVKEPDWLPMTRKLFMIITFQE